MNNNIVLPEWVYKTIKNYGNCALPNACLKMDKDLLERHLSKKTNRKIKIRTAYMNDEKQHYMFSVKLERNEYLIAEER